ncbi:MAG TPA: hypothetical protein VKV17_02185 [Bryobacteraceae bacterium]|nr:hypothetical protein [Bryobacteraceae bacterium]
MLRSRVAVSALAFGMCASTLADVTVRQSSSTKLPAFIPRELAAQWQEQSKSSAGGLLRIKGDKAFASYGMLETLTDFSRGQVTLLDPKTKHYATVPLSEFAGRFATALAAAPERAVVDVQSKRTGQTAEIHGVRTEETLTVIAMQMPFMAANSETGDGPSVMRLEVHSWIAQPSEIRRVPALGELADYAARSQRALDTADFAERAFVAVPMIGNQLAAALRSMSQTAQGLTLKTTIRIFIPAITELVQLAPDGAPPDFDPNGPVAESALDLSDISTAALPDSDFEVPPDFRAAPFDDLVREAAGVNGIAPAIQ